MKFCMECGQKAPPAAKFCPGCGNSMSLNADARVDEKEETHDDIPHKDLALSEGLVTISGENQETLTVRGVIESVPEGYESEKIVRPSNLQFKGLNAKEVAKKLGELNRSDGSKEA